jgi:carboxymethylenebutenolidase
MEFPGMKAPGPPAAAAIHAGMIDMESNTTLVQCYPAHHALPEGDGPFPAVVVLHDRFGLTPHTRSVVSRLARAGFYALAPDFYSSPSSFSTGASELLRPRSTRFEYSEEPAARERADALTDERTLDILHQAFAYLAGRAKARPGGANLLGFGMGGRLAFLAGCLFPGDARAVSCFYPEGLASGHSPRPGRTDAIGQAAALAAPVRLFYGLLDYRIRPEEREAVRQRLNGLSKDFRVEVFPEAGPDFFCEDRDTYRIHASKVAWEETLRLFRPETALRSSEEARRPGGE